jgi:3-phosphoshikimate 1-carboxyvinyltransferase
MFAPIIALSSRAITVRGEGSLLSRPMDFFDEIFPQLGIRVVSNKGKLPLEIQGPLQPRSIGIDGSLSSQFLTGLLMAYAAAGAKDVAIKVNNLKSKPYIDLTLKVMKHFGWAVENREYKEFYFSGRDAGAKESRIRYTVEGDWSGGAFLLVAGALAGPITVCGLDVSSTQADKAILRALRDCGAAMRVAEGGIEIGPVGSLAGMNAGSLAGMKEGSRLGMHTGTAVGLRAFSFDATDCPDLFPPLVALAAYCVGTTVIEGVSRLAHKESDRGLTLQEEFGKMGVSIVLAGDKMLIRGGEGLKGAVVHSRHDHRIAMACAVAALGAGGAVTIEEAQAINKSYPDFYEHLQQLGVPVEIREANTEDTHTKH